MSEAKSSPIFLNIELVCPECGHKYTENVEVPERQLEVVDVECLKCGHKWTYKGTLKSRIRCPICRSSKNKVNREIFGGFIKADINSKGGEES